MSVDFSSERATMLRAVFLTPSLHVGGAERWILSLARHFQNVECAAIVVCAPHFHPAMVREASKLTRVILAQQRGDADETRALLAAACRDADVLITWGVARLGDVTSGLPLPVIDVSHSDGAWQQQTKLVRRAAGGADFHVAVSRAALTAFPIEVQPAAKVIYNGAEVDRLAPRIGRAAQRANWTLPREANVALFLGRFDPVKGPLRLLAALHSLPADWHAIFCGHGPLQEEMRAIIAARNLASRVRLLPPQTQVGDVLAAADVLVLPSDFEGMPLVLPEAWLAGVPVAATAVSFVNEVQEQFGPLCETVPLQPAGEVLAAAMIAASARRFVARAREVAWQNFTAGAMAQRWEEFIAAACAAPRCALQSEKKQSCRSFI